MRTLPRRTALAVAAGAVAAVAVLGDPAAAAPAGPPATVDCGSGPFQVATVPGQGQFTPALLTSTHGVLVPVAFGATTFTVYDAAGNVLQTFSDPSQPSKGSAADHVSGTVLTCTFTLTVPADAGLVDQVPTASYAVVSGTVDAVQHPAR